MERIRQPYLVSRLLFQLFRLGLYQYLQSCIRLIMVIWVVFQLVSLVVWLHLRLQGVMVLYTMTSLVIFPTCCHRPILRLGWRGRCLDCILLSLSSLSFPWRFRHIFLKHSWLSFRPSCLWHRSFIWLRVCRPKERVLWFNRPLRYQLRILLQVMQSSTKQHRLMMFL